VTAYISIFPLSQISSIARYTSAGQSEHKMPVGSPMSIEFTLKDRPFLAINGAGSKIFNPGIHFTISCEDQKEIDHYWEKLGTGGERGHAGWVKDRFGLSWRIVPKILEEMQANGTEAQRERIAFAKSKMDKFDIETLHQAYEGKS
jgi:predicted 3-demethylubiquinone-9 3-methyltransferase (glyoxalase superfamily)